MVVEARALHFGREHFADAFDRLFEAGRITMESYGAGAPSRTFTHAARTPVRAPL